MAEKVEETLRELAKFHFILSEGRKGNHLLFSRQRIRETFSRSAADLSRLFQDRLDEINEALNHTFSIRTFEDKRRYLESLAPDIQDAMVFGYFQLLEGAEHESSADQIH